MANITHAQQVAINKEEQAKRDNAFGGSMAAKYNDIQDGNGFNLSVFIMAGTVKGAESERTAEDKAEGRITRTEFAKQVGETVDNLDNRVRYFMTSWINSGHEGHANLAMVFPTIDGYTPDEYVAHLTSDEATVVNGRVTCPAGLLNDEAFKNARLTGKDASLIDGIDWENANLSADTFRFGRSTASGNRNVRQAACKTANATDEKRSGPLETLADKVSDMSDESLPKTEDALLKEKEGAERLIIETQRRIVAIDKKIGEVREELRRAEELKRAKNVQKSEPQPTAPHTPKPALRINRG